MRRYTRFTIGSLAVLCFAAGCSSKSVDERATGGEGDVKTDIGVTKSEITLGALTDLSGPFKSRGIATSHGNQIWADEVNASGGICGRKIVLDLQDHGYKPDNAVPLYDTMVTKDLAIMNMLGSPVFAALKKKLSADSMLTVTSSLSSFNLSTPEALMLGQTNDLETVNGFAWTAKQGVISDGDPIGIIYLDSEYGQNALLGAKWYAKKHGMALTEAAVSASDTDMTITMTKMRSAGVKAIALALTPASVGSVAVQNSALGMNVPLIGNSPAFSASLLDNEATTKAMVNFHLIDSFPAYWSKDNQKAKDLAAEYSKKYSDQPDKAIPYGYVQGLVFQKILQQACDDGDLTRKGVLAARTKIDSIDSDGLAPKLDLSTPDQPTSREAYVLDVDASKPGGLKNADGPFESPDASEYKTP